MGAGRGETGVESGKEGSVSTEESFQSAREISAGHAGLTLPNVKAFAKDAREGNY
jgi:hypothetical protein